ncbi:hypothetical protein J6590_030219 [Homalodisca vitripennis]|nr:hypothetical protein J6590_030219 [Homalodisca vitripennis]
MAMSVFVVTRADEYRPRQANARRMSWDYITSFDDEHTGNIEGRVVLLLKADRELAEGDNLTGSAYDLYGRQMVSDSDIGVTRLRIREDSATASDLAELV